MTKVEVTFQEQHMRRHGWWTLAAAMGVGIGSLAAGQVEPKPEAPSAPAAPGPKAPEGKPAEVKPPAIVPATPPGKSLVKIGDPAPELKVQAWVKGEPVKGYERGKIYVVELWATWCGPCKESIAHLTQLQRAYKDRGVRVVAVSIWENTPPNNISDLPADATPEQVNAAYLERVKTYVQGMGDRMDYAVAFDGIEGTTANWMFRLSQSGIPCAYVINREGKMAWVGHPRALDAVLAELISGTYDMSRSPDRVAKDAARAKKVRDLDSRYQFAIKDGKHDEAVKVLDELVELDPERFQAEVTRRFRMTLVDMKDEKGAYAYARKLSEGAAKNLPQPLNDIAWVILADDQVAHRDYDVALTLALRADELSKHEDSAILDTLARAYFEKGEVDKAIEAESRALALPVAGEQQAAVRAEMDAALRKYRAAKK